MRRSRICALAALLALPMALGSCFLPDSYHAPADPLALREHGGQVEVRYTGCDPVKVKLVQVVDPRDDTMVRDDDPVVWQVRFDPPTDRRQFAIGQAVAGGVEEVPLAGSLGEKTLYVVRLVLADGQQVSTGLERNRLDDADPGSPSPCPSEPG